MDSTVTTIEARKSYFVDGTPASEVKLFWADTQEEKLFLKLTVPDGKFLPADGYHVVFIPSDPNESEDIGVLDFTIDSTLQDLLDQINIYIPSHDKFGDSEPDEVTIEYS